VIENIVQPRSFEIGLCGPNWLSRLLASLFARRRKPSADRLPDHLLRDAGLERVGGVIRRRPR
jgi:hypothetical protein